ncbi:N-acetylmuramoyl-L-alanine amidase [Nocardia halotolerans]|uniref:N-acetylmuramoyl-L-alanine amidase n=1 Tax=Nocardia halotolerans TaxID=1755878 RepID=A0ABV8VG82_9NOCA
MQPNIIKAGLCSAVSAAVVVSLSGLVPVTAHAAPEPSTGDQLAGKTIFLDPGHQGTAHAQDLARQVDNGRGGTKDCQTTGMTSLHGVPEHTINWDVAQLVQESLRALGAEVVLSRTDDTGWGGCVDDRARAANESGADVAVSIHADSAAPEQRGFHLIVPQLPIPDPAAQQAQAGPGLAASNAVRDAYVAAGIPTADYAGATAGLQTRADVAGPALTRVPLVFVEMGNGANPEDAALLESREGQLKHAVAIATGVVGFLLNKPVTKAPQLVPAQATTPSTPAQEPLEPGAAADPTTTTAPAQQPIEPGEAADPATVPGSKSGEAADPATAPGSKSGEAADPATAPGSKSGEAADPATAPGSKSGEAADPATAPGTKSGEAADPATAPGTKSSEAADPASPPARPGVSTGSAGSSPNEPGDQAPPVEDPAPPAVAPARAPVSDRVPSARSGIQVRTAPPGGAAPAPAPTPRERGTSPKAQSTPDESVPDISSLSSSLGGPVLTVMNLLMPMAQSLGMDNTAITNQLINLAYTLVGIVFGPE